MNDNFGTPPAMAGHCLKTGSLVFRLMEFNRRKYLQQPTCDDCNDKSFCFMDTQYTTSMCTILHYPNIDLIWPLLGTHFALFLLGWHPPKKNKSFTLKQGWFGFQVHIPWDALTGQGLRDRSWGKRWRSPVEHRVAHWGQCWWNCLT